MNTDAVIDAFVAKVNSSKQETLSPEEVPPKLRRGKPGQGGWYKWEIRRAKHAAVTETLQEKLPKRFPPSFLSLISRYAFPIMEVGPIVFFANSGGNTDWELSDRIFADGFMSPFLLRHGFLQFGNPTPRYNYDAVCFDTARTHKKTLECPIVQVDHEGILCDAKLEIVKEIAPSFVEFAQRIISS